MTEPRQSDSAASPPRRAALFVPCLVAALGLALTLLLWGQAREAARAAALIRFDRATDQIRETIVLRVNEHEKVLQGIRGLFAASKSVERGEFRQYVAALQRPGHGELGYGFVRYVKRPGLEAFLKATRADEAAGFEVKSAGVDPELYIVQFIEPAADNASAEGLDLVQHPPRRAAARRAVDEGRAILTEPIALVQDGRGLPGFLLMLPVYRHGAGLLNAAQRWDALEGWAYAALHVEGLFNGVTEAVRGQIDFELSATEAGGRETRLFDADGHLPVGRGEGVGIEAFAGRTFWKRLSLSVGGRDWSLSLSTTPEFDRWNRSDAQWWVLAGGLVVSLLAGAMTHTLRQGRERALALAGRMTAELREENARREKVGLALQEVSRFRQALLDSAAFAIIATTPEGVIRSFNPAAERLLGYREAELVGRQTLAMFHDPAEVAARAVEFGTMLGVPLEPGFDVVVVKSRRGLANEHEWTFVRKDGSRVPVLLAVTSLIDEGGALTGFLGLAIDISERRRTEADLIRARETAEHALLELELQKAALDQHAIVSVTDLTGRILYANANFCAISGYAEQELIGQPHRIINSGCHPPEFWRHMWQTVARGSVWSGEVCNRAKDGSLYWVKSTVVPFRDARGRVERYVAIRTDISDRKRRESELIELRDAAEAASRAKGSFLATMSHEIRTPMNGVLGFTNLLLDSPLTDAQREYVRIIQSSGQNLLTVINDILDYSKIEAGRIDLESIAFDFEQAMAECLELLGGRADEKGLTLALDYAADAPRRWIGDPGRVRQVLINFVGNAIKFTERGHVLVSVTASASSAASGGPGRPGIRVSVRDTGIGIPPDKQPALFNKFTQADSSTSRRFGGTGLGLAICKQLVELMGGQVGLESEPGMGSTFWFTVPLGEPTADPGTPDAAGPDAAGPWRQARVLVVEDTPVNRHVLEAQLRQWGIEHEAAADGPEALARLQAAARAGRPFQIALVDEAMPGMNGRELAAAIRQDGALAATALVLLPSGAQRGDSPRALAAGFCACLARPLVRRAALQRALELAWNDSVRRSAGAEANPASRPPLASVRSVPISPSTGAGAPTADGLGVGRRDPVTPAIEACDVPIHRVLVVEDTVVNQKLARHLLTRMGCRVDVAANGLEAVQMTGQFSYDLVFMDCHMPEMDGYEAARRIRAREREMQGTRGAPNGHLPIVALTAGAMAEDRQLCLAAGMDDFVTKPFMPKDLENALARWSRSLRSRMSA